MNIVERNEGNLRVALVYGLKPLTLLAAHVEPLDGYLKTEWHSAADVMRHMTNTCPKRLTLENGSSERSDTNDLGN